MECGMKCCKYLLFLFNLAFFLIGLVLIIVGGVALGESKVLLPKDVVTDLGLSAGAIHSASIFVIVLGAIVFIIGFFGCCGAWKECHWMLTIFAVLLGIVFILQLAAGIAALVARGKVEDLATDVMFKAVEHFKPAAKTKKEMAIKGWVNTIQQKFRCCGVHGYTDWTNATIAVDWVAANMTNDVPDSCCHEVTEQCGQDFKPVDIHPKGCYKKMKTMLHKGTAAIGGVAIGLAFIELVGIIMACCLSRTVKQYDNME